MSTGKYPTTNPDRQLDAFYRRVAARLEAIERAQVSQLRQARVGTYAPTLTGMAIGTGGAAQNTAIYRWRDGWADIEGSIRIGTTGTTLPGTTVTASLPSGWTFVEPLFMNGFRNIGDGIAVNNAGSQSGMLLTAMASSSTIRIAASQASGTYTTRVATGAAIPITWDNGSFILWKIGAFVNIP